MNVNVSPSVAAAEPESPDNVISLAETAPLDTVKFPEAKDAKPLTLVEASATATVTVSLPTVVLTAPVPVNVKVSLIKLIESVEELSPAIPNTVEIVWNETAPEPLVMRACPLDPSAVGRVYPIVPSIPTSICLLNVISSAPFEVSKVK